MRRYRMVTPPCAEGHCLFVCLCVYMCACFPLQVNFGYLMPPIAMASGRDDINMTDKFSVSMVVLVGAVRLRCRVVAPVQLSGLARRTCPVTDTLSLFRVRAGWVRLRRQRVCRTFC